MTLLPVESCRAGARTTMENVTAGKVSITPLWKYTGNRFGAENGEVPPPPMTVTLVCTTCGEELQGVQPPEECPVCGAPGEEFEAREL